MQKETVIDFIKRNLLIFLIIIAGLFAMGFVSEFIRLIYSVIVIVAINVIMANVAVIAFNKINFSNHDEDTEDVKLGKLIVIGLVYLGCSIAVSGSVFGIYYLYYFK